MKKDNNQTVGAVLTNLRNAKILENRAKKHRAKVTEPILANTTSEQHFNEAIKIEADANRDLSQAMKVDGVDYLTLLCEKESGETLTASFLQKLIASYAIEHNLSKEKIHDMSVVNFVQKLKSKKQATKNAIIPNDTSKLKEKSLIIPKVFISYSWTNPEHEEWVLKFATKLMEEEGCDVIFDKWDLKAGHDQNYFMEQIVTDETINKVLIICDKAYKAKAQVRAGGSGQEYSLITNEIVGKMKQEKFIPVFREFENDEPCVPAYLKGIIGFDLSSDEDISGSDYQDLVKDIKGIPKYKKPKRGANRKSTNNASSESKTKETYQQLIFESSFEKHYQLFKENMIDIFCMASQTQCSSENTKELTNLQKFRDFFKEDTGDSQNRWHRVLNGLNDYYLKQIIDNMEILRKEVELALYKIDKYTQKQLSNLKWLSSSLYRLRDVTIDYDDNKRLSIFLWSLFTGWDIVYGYISEDDQYENIFSKCRGLSEYAYSLLKDMIESDADNFSIQDDEFYKMGTNNTNDYEKISKEKLVADNKCINANEHLIEDIEELCKQGYLRANSNDTYKLTRKGQEFKNADTILSEQEENILKQFVESGEMYLMDTSSLAGVSWSVGNYEIKVKDKRTITSNFAKLTEQGFMEECINSRGDTYYELTEQGINYIGN